MIKLNKLRKEYGKLVAVCGTTLEIPKGAIFGLIGPNGAGKTTTMKMMVGLLEPTGGSVEISGVDVAKNPAAIRRNIAYLPDFFSLYDELKVWELLDFFGKAYKVDKLAERIDELLTFVQLTEKRNEYVYSLSRGMKQRLGIAKTIIHDPDVLVLDEPASGLDPKMRIDLRDKLKELAGQGKTTIISSHILTELSDVCDSVCIMERGRVVETGTIEEITARLQSAKMLVIEVIENTGGCVECLKKLDKVEFVDVKKNVIECGFSGEREDIPAVHKALVEKGFKVVSFREHVKDLEEIFMSLSSHEVS